MRDDVGLYVHFPYCSVRCNYCDFNTYLSHNIPAQAYMQAVLKEGERRVADFAAWELATIYFGGGTPSLWGAEHVGRILESVATWFPRRKKRLEITLECNPDEARPELLAAYRQAGVNRLSLGVQSLSDELLGRLNRCHTADRARAGLDAALAAGFESVSADLMFGLPGQQLEQFRSDLETLAATGIEHLSLYGLTLEPGTALQREVRAGRVMVPDDDAQAEMWDIVDETAAPFGLTRYEISSLARPGHASQHNSAYWQGRPYLGLGAGAHSFLPPERWKQGAHGVRSANIRHHERYRRHAIRSESTTDFSEQVDRETHLMERLLTGIRHLAGLNLETLSEELALDVLARLTPQLEALTREGLVLLEGPQLRLTPGGLRLADLVALRLS